MEGAGKAETRMPMCRRYSWKRQCHEHRHCMAGGAEPSSKDKAAALQLSEGLGCQQRCRQFTGAAVLEMQSWHTSTALSSGQCSSTHSKRDSIWESPWKVLLGPLWRANSHSAQGLPCFSCVCLVVTLWSLNTGIEQIPGKCYKAALFRGFSPENRKY